MVDFRFFMKCFLEIDNTFFRINKKISFSNKGGLSYEHSGMASYRSGGNHIGYRWNLVSHRGISGKRYVRYSLSIGSVFRPVLSYVAFRCGIQTVPGVFGGKRHVLFRQPPGRNRIIGSEFQI